MKSRRKRRVVAPEKVQRRIPTIAGSAVVVSTSQQVHVSGAWLLLFAASSIALGSTLGVLFIGEIMGQEPCVLCWFQRAFMFPLAVILAVACYRSDAGVWCYALPVATLGGLIAAFHTLQYFGLIPQAIEPCGSGPSCTGADMTILGAIPIPALSLVAFTAIAILLLLVRQRLAV